MRLFAVALLLIPSLAFAGGQLSFHSFGGDQVVGLYHLNENGGNDTVDATGNGNTGIQQNGCVWVSGQMGSGIYCSGSGKRVDISTGIPLGFNFSRTDAFYIVMRFKVFAGGVSGPVVIGKANLGTNPGWRVLQQVGALNDFAWKVTGGGSSCQWLTGNLTLTSDMNILDGRWHTMIVWWDGTNACTYDTVTRKSGGGGLYFDGKLPVVTLSGTSIGGDPTNNVAPSIGGSSQASTDFTNGTIDEVAFVRGVMTMEKAKRIHALFNASVNTDDQ